MKPRNTVIIARNVNEDLLNHSKHHLQGNMTLNSKIDLINAQTRKIDYDVISSDSTITQD